MAKKQRTNEQIIKDLMKESTISALFLVMGIDALHQCFNQWSDEELLENTGRLFSASSIRKQVKLMYERLHPENASKS